MVWWLDGRLVMRRHRKCACRRDAALIVSSYTVALLLRTLGYPCEVHVEQSNQARRATASTQRHQTLPSPASLLLALEVVQQDTALLALLTPILDNHTAAVDNLARIALTVQDTQTSPLAKLLAVGHLDERDLVLGAQGNDELLVRFFFASLVEDAHVRLAAIEGLGGFAEAAGQAVVDEGDLEDTCVGGDVSRGAL
jgi:hypothetical protein